MSRQVRQNVFLDVKEKAPQELPPQEEILDMKPQEEIEVPPPEVEKPTEDKIFKKELKLEAPVVKRKADRKTDQKRTVTPKMRAHLDRIRAKASESKSRKAQERKEKEAAEKEAAEPVVEEMETIPEEPVSAPYYPQANQSQQIDYDRIVNGLWDRQQRHNEEKQRIATLTEQIRQEERQKAFKESGALFQQAAAKYKKTQQAQMGGNILSGYQNKYNGHPVFQVRKNGNKIEPVQGGAVNPFDACFK